MPARLSHVFRLACGAALAGALVLPAVAVADPGNGNGNGQAKGGGSSQAQAQPSSKATPPGQAKKPQNTQSKGSPSAPGQAKKSSAAKGDPPGNNGTIKVDYPAPADSGHANRPHPGCAFQVRMFDFDDDQYGSLTIREQAPTGSDTLLSRRVLLSNDPAGGGQDVDQVYSFTAAELGLLSVPRANQGWHLKVLVDAENAPGGAKQKVFWLDCPVTETAAAPEQPAGSAAIRRPAAVRAPLTAATAAQEQPMGEVTLTPAVPAARPHGGGGLLRGMTAGRIALPFTGIKVSLLVAIAAALLLAGTLAVAGARARRTSL